MPYKFKKPTKKRHIRGKKRYVKISRGVPSGMPAIKVTSLRYVEDLERVSTAGTLNNYMFSANNIFDPNVTGTGHQPMGHDQWAILFNHYIVLGSKITIKVIPTAATTSPANVGIYLTDTVVPPYTTASEFVEARRGVVKSLVPGTTRTTYLSNTFSCKKFFNIKDVKDNALRLGAVMNNSPTDQAVFDFWYQTVDGATATVYFQVIIDYIVMFSEPKDLVQS